MKEIIISNFRNCPFLETTYDYIVVDFKCKYNNKDLGVGSPKCPELCELTEGFTIKFDENLKWDFLKDFENKPF